MQFLFAKMQNTKKCKNAKCILLETKGPACTTALSTRDCNHLENFAKQLAELRPIEVNERSASKANRCSVVSEGAALKFHFPAP